jgi:hypothetical protein
MNSTRANSTCFCYSTVATVFVPAVWRQLLLLQSILDRSTCSKSDTDLKEDIVWEEEEEPVMSGCPPQSNWMPRTTSPAASPQCDHTVQQSSSARTGTPTRPKPRTWRAQADTGTALPPIRARHAPHAAHGHGHASVAS